MGSRVFEIRRFLSRYVKSGYNLCSPAAMSSARSASVLHQPWSGSFDDSQSKPCISSVHENPAL
jgi:hypothetical protein